MLKQAKTRRRNIPRPRHRPRPRPKIKVRAQKIKTSVPRRIIAPIPLRPANEKLLPSQVAVTQGDLQVSDIPVQVADIPTQDYRVDAEANSLPKIELPEKYNFEPPPLPDLSGIDEALAFQMAVRRKIEEKKKYPIAAQRRSLEGNVILKFLLGTDGSVSRMQVLRSSGNSLLDKAALDAVRVAAPFPPPPAGLGRKPFWLEVAISFSLTG